MGLYNVTICMAYLLILFVYDRGEYQNSRGDQPHFLVLSNLELGMFFIYIFTSFWNTPCEANGSESESHFDSKYYFIGRKQHHDTNSAWMLPGQDAKKDDSPSPTDNHHAMINDRWP